MLDSLVRVSRRVYENHFVKIANFLVQNSNQYNQYKHTELCSPYLYWLQGQSPSAFRRKLSFVIISSGDKQ